MATLHGKNGAVYLQGANAEAESLSQATDWSIDLDFDMIVANALGDTYEQHLKGLLKAKGTLKGNYDTQANLPWDFATAQSPRKSYIYPDRLNPSNYYYFLCWPKLTVDGGLAKKVEFTSNFEIEGPVGRH